MNETVPLVVPSHLIRMPVSKATARLDAKVDYENGAVTLTVEPQVAKFAGFEVGKLNILKIKVVNKSPKSQRIYILPPQTSFFSVKFDKKGLLASGMAEELYIHFTPNEYKYYSDTIRINSEHDHILVPIYAYPAVSRDGLRELFPALIDFGTVEIGQSVTNRYPLHCKIPLNFEFEFSIVKDHPDIKISPQKGILPGKGTVEIEITYQPSMNVTVVLQAELKLAQFDFEPLLIKVMGSGRHANNVKQRRPSSNQKLKQITEAKSKNEPILDELQEQSPKILLDQSQKSEGYVAPNEQFKTLIKSKGQTNYSIRKSQITSDKESIVEKKVTVSKPLNQSLGLQGRQQQEKAYLEHFNQVAQLDKDKDIRFFQCIGDFPTTQQTVDAILREREQYLGTKLREEERAGITRYQLQINSDCAIVEQVLPLYECQWDFDKNDTMKISRIKRKKFVDVVTRVIYRIRFDNRISKIRAFLKNAKSREQVKKMVNQDWQKAEYAGVGKKDFIQFQFEFEENNLGRFLLPVQYAQSNNFSSFRFDINPRTGFDDWAPIEQIPYCDQEVMQYKNWDYPQLVIHPPLQQSLNFRSGAEEEYSIRGRMGPVNQIVASGERMQKLLSKPPEVETFRLLEPHKTLKYLHSYNPSNPVEPGYYTTFSTVDTIGGDLDPDLHIDVSVLKQEFIAKTPGYSNLPLLLELNLEQAYYQERNLQLPQDFGFEAEVDKYCPELMANREYDDNLTDDDSDGEGPPRLDLEDVGEFLRRIEQDDKTIMALKGDTVDSQAALERTINKNLYDEKEKWLSTVPSKTADYNKFIQSNPNKLIIL